MYVFTIRQTRSEAGNHPQRFTHTQKASRQDLSQRNQGSEREARPTKEAGVDVCASRPVMACCVSDKSPPNDGTHHRPMVRTLWGPPNRAARQTQLPNEMRNEKSEIKGEMSSHAFTGAGRKPPNSLDQ